MTPCFSVVLDALVLADSWRSVHQHLTGAPVSLIVLAPRVAVVTPQRDLSRTKQPLGTAWAVYLDQAFRASMAGAGLWLDTSDQTPVDTVNQIPHLLQPGL